MMLSSKTAGTLIAEMLMVRVGGWGGLFMLLEGTDDERFWRARVKLRLEALVVAEGVCNLRECMKSLPPQLSGKVCAVADSDFRMFLPADPFAGCHDVFFYDEGYLETFVLNSNALRKLLAAHAESARVSNFLKTSNSPTIYTHLRRIASVFARLRIINERRGAGQCFNKSFTPYRYVDQNLWQLDQARLFADFASALGTSLLDIESECAGISRIGQVQLVHGHDVLKILSIGLRHAIGSRNIGPEALMKDLCLAFEDQSLKHKRLVRMLRAWAGPRPLL